MERKNEHEKICDYLSARVMEDLTKSSGTNLIHKDPGDKDKCLNQIKKNIEKITQEERILISSGEIDRIATEIFQNSFKYGSISLLMDDPEVNEIMVNNFNEVYVEKNGRIKKTNISFRNNQQILNLVEKIISPLGLRLDESSPIVDARLIDGSRINAVLSPVSFNEIVVTIRKFKKNILNIMDLEAQGTINKQISDFLLHCIGARLNILISGGTSSGKTTILNILSGYISQNERIITIEDTLELNINLPHVVRLEAKPANFEGKGEINIRKLVRNSLRMRPDRIIIGEIRGDEVVDILQAMNTGHSGSLTTIHANSSKDALIRLESLLLIANSNLNSSMARRMIASSFNLIIHVIRQMDGRRIISEISEVKSGSKLDGDNILLEINNIFTLNRLNGKNEEEEILIHTGYEPSFLEKIKLLNKEEIL